MYLNKFLFQWVLHQLANLERKNVDAERQQIDRHNNYNQLSSRICTFRGRINQNVNLKAPYSPRKNAEINSKTLAKFSTIDTNGPLGRVFCKTEFSQSLVCQISLDGCSSPFLWYKFVWRVTLFSQVDEPSKQKSSLVIQKNNRA